MVAFQVQCIIQSHLHIAEMNVIASIRECLMVNCVNFTNLNIVGKTVEQNGLCGSQAFFVQKLKPRVERVSSEFWTEQCCTKG